MENEEFEFKIANTQDEFMQGYELLYQCYLEQGYQSHQKDFPYRITKYHILPTATMFIAKKGDLVIGTVSHIIDSKLGLPTDNIVDLKDLRKSSQRMAEISALAIRKGYRRKFSILFYLTRIVYHFSRQYAGCDAWVISISPKIEVFYRAIFFFQRIHDGIKKYSFVNNVSSVSLLAELNELPILFKHFYGRQIDSPDSMNLNTFYNESFDKIFSRFPESIVRGATTPTMSRELVKSLFSERTSIWRGLTEAEKIEVLNSYNDPTLFPEAPPKERKPVQRNSPRHLTNIGAEIISVHDQYINIQKSRIINVSARGFLLQTTAWVDDNRQNKILIEVSPHLKIQLEFTVLNQVGQDFYACSVQEENLEVWQDYYLEIDRFCKSHLADKTSKN